jgi:cytochrome d ubiquinol oxidase subunit II
METLWFCLAAFSLTGYVVLDGFDLGAGIVHLFAARGNEQRRVLLASIGPFWDANEVWLLASGGTIFFAFPALYASSFSGFYLPLMMVLWLLILRGIAIEFRNHIESAVWTPLWDVVFSGASGLLAVFLGAAIGNVVRGVPLDSNGEFFLPLWGEIGILDPYTIATGLFAFAALMLHGVLWVNLKTDLPVRDIATWAWRATVVLTAAVTWATFLVQPLVPFSFAARPWGYCFPAIAILGLGVAYDARKELRAFAGSCVFLIAMMSSVAFGIYPNVLPAVGNEGPSLTIYNTATGSYGMGVGLAWWLPGMALAMGYAVFLYRRFAGKVAG